MKSNVFKGTLLPPSGSPNWKAPSNISLPLIYLGWGQRNYKKSPLVNHSDVGCNYIVYLEGEITLTVNQQKKTLQAPCGIILDADCIWGVSQKEDRPVRILSWVWRGMPIHPSLKPDAEGCIEIPLLKEAITPLKRLHDDCRQEVEKSDPFVVRSLRALRYLVEITLLRANPKPHNDEKTKWKQAIEWIGENLSIHSPVPALSDYLEMSTASLHRFFIKHSGISPGLYFRKLKVEEARRRIDIDGLSVKLAAYQLGYKHPSDLTRALRMRTCKDKVPITKK